MEYPVVVLALVLCMIAVAYLLAAIAKPEWFA
jgi:hypothetical protein